MTNDFQIYINQVTNKSKIYYLLVNTNYNSVTKDMEYLTKMIKSTYNLYYELTEDFDFVKSSDQETRERGNAILGVAASAADAHLSGVGEVVVKGASVARTYHNLNNK